MAGYDPEVADGVYSVSEKLSDLDKRLSDLDKRLIDLIAVLERAVTAILYIRQINNEVQNLIFDAAEKAIDGEKET